MRQSSCLEVIPSHPFLERAENVFDDGTPDPHGIGHLVQAPPHSLDHRLMFPTGDAALLAVAEGDRRSPVRSVPAAAAAPVALSQRGGPCLTI